MGLWDSAPVPTEEMLQTPLLTVHPVPAAGLVVAGRQSKHQENPIPVSASSLLKKGHGTTNMWGCFARRPVAGLAKGPLRGFAMPITPSRKDLLTAEGRGSVGNRHGKAKASGDVGLIKRNPVSPSFPAETQKPKSPQSPKFAAIVISLITVPGSLYLAIIAAFYSPFPSLCKVSKNPKDPGEGWGEKQGENAHSGQ